MKRVFLLLAALSLLVPGLRAELLIYQMSLNATGTRVNYPDFQSAIAVVDQQAGSFSTIFIVADPLTGSPFYTTALLSGSYFELLEEDGGDIYAVLQGSSTGDDLAETVSMQIVGETSNNVDVGPGTSLRVARKMRGFFLANAGETVSSDDDGIPEVETGFAGASRVTARFDGDSTREANNQRLDEAGAVTAITQTLEQRGIGPEPTPTPAPSPSPTPSPTPSL